MSQVLWCKMEDGTLTAEVGPSGTEVGTITFRPEKFGNGGYSTSTANYAKWLMDSIFTPNNYTVEFWFETDFSVTNGVSGDAGTHVLFSVNCDRVAPGVANIIDVRITGAGIALNVFVNNVFYAVTFTTGLTWGIGELHHFGFTVERTGIDGGVNTIELRIDDVLLGQSSLAIANQVETEWDLYGFVYFFTAPIGTQNFAIDNIKVDNDSKTDFSDRFWEDGIDPTVPPVRTTPISCDRTEVQVLILGSLIDINEKGYVKKIIKTDAKKTFKRDKLFVNVIQQRVQNSDDFFSVDNTRSVFSNIRWIFEPFKIINADGEVIWNGIIQDIKRDHKTKTATIVSLDLLYKFSRTIIEYESTTWETPGDAFKNIASSIGFTSYDPKTVEDSIAQYTLNGCKIKCNFNKSDDCTFQQAIEKIGEVGCADVYVENNITFFKHWQSFTGGVKTDLFEKDIRNNISVASLEKEIINNYHIGYDGDAGVSTTDADNNNIGQISRQADYYSDRSLAEFNTSAGNQIVMMDLASAVYIGECYIRRTHKNLSTDPKPLAGINFKLPEKHKDWIDLQSYFRLTLSDESWSGKLFEVFGRTIDYNTHNISLIAVEVDENA